MSDEVSNIFSKMSDRRDIVYFVREIEKNPCLYDQNSYEYANKVLKRRVWLEIAKKCNSSVPDCKEKWRKIRIAYMRSLKQCHGDNPPSRPYYLSSYLHFITPSKYADDVPTTNTSLSPNPSEESFKEAKTKLEIDDFDDDTGSPERLEIIDHTHEVYMKKYQKPTVLQRVQDFEKEQQESDKGLNLSNTNKFQAEIPNRQIEISNRLQTEINNRPQMEINNRLQMEVKNKPQMEINNRLQTEINTRPQMEINNRSQVDNTKTAFDKRVDVNANIRSRKRSSCCDDSNPRKMFLLSLLPDIEVLTDHEMRTFRREVIGVIDNIVASRDSVLINLSNKVV